jgi:hypothetical protein
VRRADLQRHQVVAETAEQRRDDDEEHHQYAVIGNQDVPELPVRGAVLWCLCDETRAFQTHVLDAGVHQFHPHVDGETDGQKPGEPGHEQVKNPDVLVVGGHEPAAKDPAGVVMFVAVDGCVCHVASPYWL